MEKAIWELNDLLEGKTTQQITQEIQQKTSEFETYREKLKPEPTLVLEIIEKYEEITVLMTKISAYYSMKFYENTADTNTLSELTKLEQLGTEISNKTMFFSLWFGKLSEEDANKIIDSEETKEYKYYLESIRKNAKYTRSEEVEQIINIKDETNNTDNFYEIFTSEFTFEWEGKELTQEELRTKVKDKDPKTREKAYDLLLKKFKDNSTLLSEMYKSLVLDWHNEATKIRGYKDSLDVRNNANDVETQTVNTMLEVIKENNEIFHEYFKLRRDINNKSGHKYENSRYHIYAPYTAAPELKFTYEEAKEKSLQIFKDFDERFYDAAKQIFDKNHIHSHPQKNKRSGAFCYAATTKDTPYIMLNHQDKYHDLSTMVHELGHGIHDILASKQKEVNYHPVLIMAETASIFSEMVLSKQMLKELKDPKQKIALLMEQIDGEWASIVRQANFLAFEIEAHKKIPKGTTKEELDKTYMQILKDQFGDMQIAEEFASEWNYIPHIHVTPFYVYAYAWGNLMVLSLYKMYEENPQFKEKIIQILQAGKSKKPKEILLEAGIDIQQKEFWQKGMDEIKQQIKELKKLSEEI